MTKFEYKDMVVAEFEYCYQNNKFYVTRAWPCRDKDDADLIVRFYGYKTGAIGANFNIEDIKYEEVKSPA